MSPYVPLAAALLAACVFVYLPDPPAVLLARRLGGPAAMSRAQRAIAGAFAGLLAGAWLGPAALLLLVGWLAGVLLHKRIAQARTRRAHESGARTAVCEACELMAAELRAGRSPSQALDSGAAVFAGLAPAAVAATLGGDVPRALRTFSGPGQEALRPLAAAWLVAERSGASLATLLDRTVATLRESQSVRDEVSAQLSAPRATSRVLAALPLAGVGLGFGMDANPLGFLLGTPAGMACLAAGTALAVTGLLWVERLARSAEDTG
ncbi:type II secretion system F family protein [Flindersiella endophytica]